jgi:hypothetical protein
MFPEREEMRLVQTLERGEEILEEMMAAALAKKQVMFPECSLNVP